MKRDPLLLSNGMRKLLAPTLAVMCFVAYMPALGAGFSDFDDPGFLLETRFWRGLSVSNITEMFTTMRLGHYQPLTYLSHAIEYSLFGLNPAVFHFTNIALHAISAILVMKITQRVIDICMKPTANADLVAWFVALIWMLNPMRVESVAWITERRDVLSAVFLLYAMLLYCDHATERAPKRTFVSCVMMLTLSLFSKAWGITFIAVSMLCDILLFQRLPLNPLQWRKSEFRGVLLEKTPFAALSLIFGFIASRAVLEAGPGSVSDLASWGVDDRLCQAIYGLGFYASHALITFEHAALRELPSSLSFAELRVIAPAAAIVLIAVGLFLLSRTRGTQARLIALALLVFCALVSPVLGITQAGIQIVAERYSYLSTIPLLMLLVPLIATAIDRRRMMTIGTVLAFISLCAVLTHRQSRVWGDTLLLWEQSIASGEDGPILRNFHARQLEQRSKFTLAAGEYRKSLAFDPKYGDSWFGLANSLRGAGDHLGALDASAKAAEFATDTVPAKIGEGLSFIALARHDDAIRSFESACIELERRGNPQRIGRPYLLIAAAYGESGQDEQALVWLRKAAEFPDTREEASRILIDLESMK